ncbi:MAG: IPT/TIG domain-containing protein [Spirochaetaceae bacterium]|nr:IPT/TIG domain-containing protein [Spirochaetaceae bacterium]
MLEPRIGKTGDYVTIHGHDFGEEQGESFVSFGGIIPTQTSYAAWNNNLIVVRIPDFGESCMLTVQCGSRKSNGVLFSTEDSMPVLSTTARGLPVISAIVPAETHVGKIIEIQGNGFGESRETSQVYFTWGAETRSGLTSPLPVLEEQGGYELWNDRTLQVRVPDGAVSGLVQVVTAKGASNSALLTISGAPGTKKIKDRKTYSIAYSVDVRVAQSTLPNFLFLWLPLPANSSTQLNKDLLERNIEPFIENYRGTALYQFIDVPSGFSRKVSVSYLVDVFGIETEVQAHKVSAAQEPAIEKALPAAPVLNSSDAARIEAEAHAITGNETNPYTKARLIYTKLLSEPSQGAYNDVMRFCALSRAAKLSAIPVAGVLVAKNRQTLPHTWAEFWLDGFGWVPVDITLGKGTAPSGFMLPGNYAEYYFGSLDNNRLSFSHGETQLAPLDGAGRTLSRPQEYALQNIWEESSGGITAYSSHWSEITITGIY